jgi:hypothetical protein
MTQAIDLDLDKLTPAPWQTDNWDDVTFAWFMSKAGETDRRFVGLARAACDVMMRRGWSPLKSRDGWRVDTGDGCYFCYGKEDEDGAVPAQWSHPFIALVEADEWQKANMEKS